MITQIELSNVRIFEGSDWVFPLAPLTVFCGTNSAGKSTILKTLLLLRQNQGVQQPKIRFVGKDVDFGSFNAFVSHNRTDQDAIISISAQVHNSAILHRSAKNSPRESGTSTVKMTITLGSSPVENTENVTLQTRSISDDSLVRCVMKSGRFESINDDTKERFSELDIELSHDSSGSLNYKLFFPETTIKQQPILKSLFESFTFETTETRNNEKFIRANTSVTGFIPQLLTFENERNAEKTRRKKTSREKVQIPLDFFFEIAFPFKEVEALLGKLEHIGPLRSPAQRYYIAPSDWLPGLDPAGEFLPYVLKGGEDLKVTYVEPGETKPIKDSLTSALNSWLNFLRTGETKQEQRNLEKEIEIATTKDVMIEFKLRSNFSETSHALMDSGVGYSQVLPILVKSLLAEKGTTLIIEQPELHLNPALQVRLAEFFIAMTRAGKQILIESHSEHIVNAIRVLAAEDETGDVAKRSAIFYIDNVENLPRVFSLSIQEDGSVPEWPSTFFGEAATMTSRLLRAQKRFRNSKK